MARLWPISGIGVVNAIARGRNVEVTRNIRFSDGRRGLLDIYAPREVEGAPAAVFFYGGSWEEGDREDYRFVAMALANRGVVTAVPDYRLYPGVRFPDFIGDGAKAVHWMRRSAIEFGADPRLIFLIGHSAGAYIASMLALDHNWIDAKCQDSNKSLEPIAGMIGLSGPYDFLPLQSPTLKRIFDPAGGDLSSSQPIQYARGDAAPMLLVSGLSDKTVSPANSRKLAARINILGGEAETRFYKGIGHTGVLAAFSPLLRPLAPSLADTLHFIRKHGDRICQRSGSPRSYQPSRSA